MEGVYIIMIAYDILITPNLPVIDMTDKSKGRSSILNKNSK